jgi:hypothetical protein
MLKGKGVEETLKDGQLCLEGSEVVGAEVGAMRGVGLGGLCPISKGSEAYSSSSSHYFVEINKDEDPSIRYLPGWSILNDDIITLSVVILR